MRRFESTLSTTSIKYNPASWGDLRAGFTFLGNVDPALFIQRLEKPERDARLAAVAWH
jgi:allophanate hydrolase subunit 1